MRKKIAAPIEPDTGIDSVNGNLKFWKEIRCYQIQQDDESCPIYRSLCLQSSLYWHFHPSNGVFSVYDLFCRIATS